MSEVVVVLQVGDSLARAARLMRVGHIRHLPVVDEENRVLGLVTHRSLLAGDLPEEVSVEMRMERDVLTIGPEESAAGQRLFSCPGTSAACRSSRKVGWSGS
jgi:CBS-domain-containing membrane protein